MPSALLAECRGFAEPSWIIFDGLARVVEASRPDEVLPALAAVEAAAQSGLYAAGYLAYEAAVGLDDAFVAHPCDKLPLVWFGLFRQMHALAPSGQGEQHRLGDWTPSLDQRQYDDAIARIKDYIAHGDTYQVNYTQRLRATFSGDPWPLFLRLCRAQQAGYGAYIDTGRHVICSASPELFFSLDGEDLLSRPMKGTAPRGRTCREDELLRAALAASPKDRAENAMIVDMMRNDIGRIARRGSVRVLSALDIERYPTLFQMTSTVAAKTAASLVDIFRALFPAASITGAPKIRTMQIIRELEPSCRGVYTGCIGYVAPNRKARFNVAIRTVQIDRVAGEAEYGVGGGIVWDSTSGGEYEECRVKAQVLTTPERPRFELLETLLYEPADGYFLLEEHLRRLEASAAYFDYSIDLSAIRDRLRQAALGFADSRRRVRLCLSHDGKIAIESAVLATSAAARPWRLKLAQSPVNSRDVFLYHKTTCRQPYDAALASRGDCDDVVLWNEDRQLTETTIANIVIQKGDGLVTPPVTCGLLAGVFRAHLLETGQIREEIVTVDDLRRAKAVFAINSVRKWLPAEVIL